MELKMDEINYLLNMLDEALDDIENDRIITEEELWAELDTI